MKAGFFFIFILQSFMMFFLSFCTLKTSNEVVKEHTVYMNIEGIKFDSIQAKLAIPGKWVAYTMKTYDYINWFFNIPDSIFTQFHLLTFKGFEPDKPDQDNYGFFIFRTDTVSPLNSILTSNENNIHVNILYIDTIVSSERIGCLFQIKEEETDPEVPLSLYFYEKYFAWGDGNLPYEEVVDNYQKLITKYPNSYALAKLVKCLVDWLKIEDLEKIYNLFSDKIKSTDQGFYLKDYVDRKISFTKFDNIQLPNWKTEMPEYILQDTTKPCLVVFSASWCSPCHEQIPLLKEIYNQYRSKLDIVYISTDREETIDAWKKLMEKEEIPWRSVLAGYENGKISEKYFISFIPQTYLVNPDGSFEDFDVRDKVKQEKLKNMLTK